jgi:hypothetical protein
MQTESPEGQRRAAITLPRVKGRTRAVQTALRAGGVYTPARFCVFQKAGSDRRIQGSVRSGEMVFLTPVAPHQSSLILPDFKKWNEQGMQQGVRLRRVVIPEAHECPGPTLENSSRPQFPGAQESEISIPSELRGRLQTLHQAGLEFINSLSQGRS